ncbi:SRPBCC family protein [Nonomuraea rhizosphaerae]|uniref:SRPBCC family protein n=1 Tax=Nonomuraea rhizosphaerae TaxID=2665663 RepID=UPI001C5ECB7A|nr:SRPBCC domain-containing protein [Nonomuraea rhizosphaerae]
MTLETHAPASTVRIERTYPATPETVWRLWTTAEGIESWWSPDGFTVSVTTLEPRPGGDLVYTMTATAPEQIAFMEGAGLPLSTESRKKFVEVDEPATLSYTSLADFIPGVEPYDFLTVVEIRPVQDGVRITMTVEAMHDEEWTQRLVAGRGNELDNLGRLLGSGA